MMDYCIIIPAGGKGSRLYPLTKEFPKPYLPLYYNDNNIIRLIDIPLSYAKKRNIETFIALDYLKEKLLYLKDKYQTNIIETHYEKLSDAIFELLNQTNNYNYYSVYAPDFLIPGGTIDEMLKMIDRGVETVALCSLDNSYSRIKVRQKNGYLNYEGEEVTDLTFHISSLEKGKNLFKNVNNLTNMWEYLYPKNSDLSKAKIYLTDIKHIDIGTPDTYYEVLMKLNVKDKNGNVVFPGAKINKLSRNIVALPNSDSSSFILEDCIVPEEKKVYSFDDILKVKLEEEKFNKIKIKNYI